MYSKETLFVDVFNEFTFFEDQVYPSFSMQGVSMTQPTYGSPCKHKVIFTKFDYGMKDTYLTSEDEIFNLMTLMMVEEDVLVLPFG